MEMEQQRSQLVAFIWKVPVIAAVYFAGANFSGWMSSVLGLQFPEFPGREYRPILNLLAALVLAAGVALLARGVRGSATRRWLVLFAFTYVSFCVNNQIEGAVFSTASGFAANLVFFLIPCAMIAGAAALLFKGPDENPTLTTVFADRPVSAWWWRFVIAWLAFPLIYYFFGAFAYPLVKDSYQSGDFALEVPSQSLILGAVFTRSLLFLLASIPVLICWSRSRRCLTFSLGATLAVMVGVVAMIESSWLPTTMRVVHGVEITLDSQVHAWVMVALLVPGRPRMPKQAAVAAGDRGSIE